MRETHPNLASKDWKIDEKVLSAEYIIDDQHKPSIPILNNQTLVCWLIQSLRKKCVEG